MCDEKVYLIEGHEIVLVSPEAYERTLRELEKPETYWTRIFNVDQVVVEKIKNPHYKTGQYYFAIKTCDGVPPPKHRN